MFKDYHKYLSTTLKVYLFVLIVIFIMKIVGLDYFGIKIDNQLLIDMSNYVSSNFIGDIINFITLYVQFYFYLCITTKKKKLYLYSFVGTYMNWSLQYILMDHYKMNSLYSIISIGIMIILPIVVNRKITIKRQIKYVILMTLYQFISLFIRNINMIYEYGNFIVDTILNFDQILLLGITYNVYFMKGEIFKWEQVQEAGSSLLKKMNLKQLLKKLHQNYLNFKKQNEETKLTIIIYFILSLIWNLLTIFIVLLIATLNHTFIECIFILTSFWLSKRVFGKAFHLSSMLHCFIISNLTYYFLNRITTPLGISILVPIMLGVGLSYVTYAKQTLDLMVDAYKWKVMARHCDNEEMRAKYMQVSDTLFELFMKEHNNIGTMFKEK